ncbi:MAG: serine/threonine-protein phosphatase [Planctomycetes bacterium]|nr:serine/threonine-protein phosphatase [Planctomycetota bacterium]
MPELRSRCGRLRPSRGRIVNWQDRLEIGGLTDVGMRRSNNQDAFRTLLATGPEQWRQRGHVFVVADGMGAHAVGELASKLAVDSIPHTYNKLVQLPHAQAIVKSFQDANALIYHRGSANRDFQGMGTTTTALVLLPEGALIGHVGDSRAYRMRDGRIEQLSFDHSLAWELVRRRQLTLEQARVIVPNNVITRSLGPEAEVQVDVGGPYPVRHGDVFLLCSDGLSNQVEDAEIGVLARYLPAQEACQYLVDLANLRGGPDNITLIIVRLGDPLHMEVAGPAKPSPYTELLRNYPLLCRTIGILSLLSSLPLSFLGPDYSGLAAWVVGSLSLLMGVIWRFVSRRRVKPPPPEPVAYRHTSCLLDKAQIGRFFAQLEHVHSIATEQGWGLDWTQFAAHRSAADRCVEAGDLVAALRELCQALHLLAEAQRTGHEQARQLLEGS